jgi:hypothetical protein
MSGTNGSYAEAVLNANMPAGSGLAGSGLAGSESAGSESAGSELAVRRPSSSSAARVAASRANSRKSTGPRTAAGKRRSSQNALKGSSRRLLGAVEAKILGQPAGAAEELYRELIRPYERAGEPAPPMLAMHFHDLARLRLELEAWERIRDAQIEERWRQGQIELRKRLHKLQVDLPAKVAEVFEKGLAGLDDSPAKTKHQVQCLYLLKQHLERHDLDIEPILEKLYGKELDPPSERAQTICIRCRHLLDREQNQPVGDAEFDSLLDLVALEEQDAISAYGLYLDQTSLPLSARLARLGPGDPDRSMTLHGERLRQAIDRKQRVIIGLLRLLRLRPPRDADDSSVPQDATDGMKIGIPAVPGAKKRDSKISKNEARQPFRINKTGRKKG